MIKNTKNWCHFMPIKKTVECVSNERLHKGNVSLSLNEGSH